MAKTKCDICGEPLVMFKKHKASNGHICHNCFIAAGYSSGMVCFADSIERIKSVIAERKKTGVTMSYREAYQEAKREAATKPITCPKCGSTSISANKKGYGIGKGVVGAAVAGPIGLTLGNAGAKKIRITCLACGYQWIAGKR